MTSDFAKHYLENAIAEFRALKRLGERAMEQLSEEQFFITLDAESNSIAIIVKHLAGNMRSRWVDFLTTDGEKPDRHRDQEFILDAATRREQILEWWDQGWQHVFAALEALQPADVLRTILIRREPHTVTQAITRQTAHYATHVGQIVFLAKHLKSADSGNWNTLSVPRGQSEQFNQQLIEQAKDQQHPVSHLSYQQSDQRS